MLLYLHVKNLALIDEIEVEFKQGLNILTGDSGAGKSIIIGSVNLALGKRYRADILRAGADFGLVELIFATEDKNLLKKLAELDFFPEDGKFTLSRKLMEGRSVCRLNAEIVSAAALKEAADILIDICGQHDNVTLLYKRNHLSLLDTYAKDTVAALKEAVGSYYREYKNALRLLEEATMDDQSLKREISLTEYEIREIEEARLSEDEDEKLEEEYRRMDSAKKIRECIAEAYKYTDGGASDFLSRALRVLTDIQECDRQGEGLYGRLSDIDGLLSDFNRDILSYADSFEFSEEEYDYTGQRLDLINRLKAKYGNSIADINEYYRERSERLKILLDHENYVESLKGDFKKAEEKLKKTCEALSAARKEAAEPFVREIRKAVADLNFPYVKIELHFDRLRSYTANGIDDAQLYISANPGEALRPLSGVASGGELSRIMLAIKSVLADREDTPTLIFDEIDSGISGVTAGAVAEKLRAISRARQVICITHLPQIAASADSHFLIQKKSKDNKTRTEILCLNENESVRELARILSGANITDKILESASEMKEMAKRENKNSC